MSLVYDNFAGGLDDLHGVTCGAALFGAGYVPTAADTTIASISGELTGGDYARQTFVAAWDATALRLKVRDADHWPTYDAASTTPNITQVVYYRVSDGKLISVVDYTSQAGVDGWTLQPANGFAGVEPPGLINDRLDALEATTVAGVAPVSGDYPLAALIAAGLGGGTGGGGTSMLYAIQVASDTPVDGTATDVDLVTANGYYSVPIATLTGILSDYADLGLTVYVGGDGGDGTCVGLYSIPGDTDPWEAYTPNADTEVRFLTSERQGLLTNADGPLTLPDPTAPATKVDTHSIAANRVQVFDDPAASPANYTPDDGGKTLDAHLIGIDAALAGGGGGGVSLSSATPHVLGTAAAGSGTAASRDDHVHAMPSASDVGAPPTSRTVSAGTGLTGGGDLSADRTLSIDTATVVDKTTAQTLTNKTLTAPAISSPTGLVKADVGLGSVTNDAQLKIASNLSDLASASTARTNLGLGTLAVANYAPNAVRVISAARTTGSTVIATPIVPVVNGATTLAIALGDQLFCRVNHSGQTLTTLGVLVSATSLTGSQTIEICCYNDLGDWTPGTRAWTQSLTIGTSTGWISASSLSLAMPTGSCWISVLNPSGNAGTVTLRTGTPTMAPAHTQMAAGSFTPVWKLTSVASATSDASAYTIRSSSTGSGVYGVDASTTFPVVGALA